MVLSKLLLFTPTLGEMIQFGEHIFTPRPSVPSSLPAEFLDRDWPEPEVGVVNKNCGAGGGFFYFKEI